MSMYLHRRARHMLLQIKTCRISRQLSTTAPPGGIDPALTIETVEQFEAFSRRRNGKRLVTRSSMISEEAPSPQALFGDSLPSQKSYNPLLGTSDGMFPNLQSSWKPLADNSMDLSSFKYPLDSIQLDEIRSVITGFVRSWSDKSTIPRIAQLSYAEAMGDSLMEALTLGLARDLKADCFTFHARDFGPMLDGCSRVWFGRPYFTDKTAKKDQNEQILSEDEIELASVPRKGTPEKWLSHLLKRNPSAGKKNGSGQGIDGKIKESVTLYTVLKFLHLCMSSIPSKSDITVIHLSGFSNSLSNPVLKGFITKFSSEFPKVLVITSECNPKADVCSLEESSSPSASLTTMPLDLSAYTLTKGRCERLAEIPNTPEYDANWLLDRRSFGGLKLFIVPPKDQEQAKKLSSMLEQDHQERVRSFNVKRLEDVLQQLGIVNEADMNSIGALNLTKSPLLLSEAIYISFMASDPSGKSTVTTESLAVALENFQKTRQLHKTYYTSSEKSAIAQQHAHKLDLKTMNKYEKRLLPCIVTADMVKTRFEDIGSHDRVKKSLHELITLPLERPELFSSGILKEAVSGILLFGPPGTGKTMLAKAVAAQSKSNFIAVNSSNIYDMYVGEGEKNVKALFKLARKLSPCIIFIDEVDAILDARSNAMGKASRVEILNEFMAEWDGLLSASASARVMVMAATNRPFALDDAVLRRLPRRILVDLPDSIARLKILQILLKSDKLDPSLSLELIAGPMTVNYSGSDLKNVCIAAAMSALRRGMTQAHASERPEMTLADFEAALHEVPASVSDSMDTLVELRRWDQAFGEGKKLAKSSFGFA